MGLPPESDGAVLWGCMQTDTMVKWAMGIGALSVAGGAIALLRGASFLGVVENVGNILILIALVVGKPIALREMWAGSSSPSTAWSSSSISRVTIS
jgi:hypothetical protein